jgi:hypothetical protein
MRGHWQTRWSWPEGHKIDNKGECETITPNKRIDMKTMRTIKRLSVVVAFAMLAAVGTSSAFAQQGAKGGATKLMELSAVKSPAEAEALKPGDTVAMVCSKCKSVQVTYVSTESKEHVKKLIVGEKHICPGCKSTIEVVGHGKAKTDTVKHVCQKCGDESAFCCATKAGTGGTLGMAEKK